MYLVYWVGNISEEQGRISELKTNLEKDEKIKMGIRLKYIHKLKPTFLGHRIPLSTPNAPLIWWKSWFYLEETLVHTPGVLNIDDDNYVRIMARGLSSCKWPSPSPGLGLFIGELWCPPPPHLQVRQMATGAVKRDGEMCGHIHFWDILVIMIHPGGGGEVANQVTTRSVMMTICALRYHRRVEGHRTWYHLVMLGQTAWEDFTFTCAWGMVMRVCLYIWKLGWDFFFKTLHVSTCTSDDVFIYGSMEISWSRSGKVQWS